MCSLCCGMAIAASVCLFWNFYFLELAKAIAADMQENITCGVVWCQPLKMFSMHMD